MDNTQPQTTRHEGLRDLVHPNWGIVSTLLATTLACIVLLPLLGHKPLTNWDEGIYAGVSREMLTLGFLVPHWNYQPWFEKPPLMLWITAIFFKLFGVNELWARAGSAVSGVAIVALLHGWLTYLKNNLAAWLSSLILLSTFGFLHVCRVGETDVLLSLGCAIALIGLSVVEQHRSAGWYVFWAGFAIALMTKGAASIVIVIAAIVVAIVERWPASRFVRSFWLGLMLFLAAVLPWHLYMYCHFGAAFVTDYFGFHVLSRATHQIEDHVTHWWYYLWVLLISAAPFVLLYPIAVVDSFRRARYRCWAIFAVVVVVFFTIVQTRLPHYIAPAYPALALLTAVLLADRLRQIQRQRRQSPVAFWGTITVIAISLFAVGALLTSAPRRNLHEAKVGPNIVASEKESIQLLRSVFKQPQSVQGPLLVWWQGNARSIATAVFYANRSVQQVELEPLAPGTPTDKYLYQPEPFANAVAAGPRLILLDRYLVPQIPAQFSYKPILTGPSMAIGIIAPRSN